MSMLCRTVTETEILLHFNALYSTHRSLHLLAAGGHHPQARRARLGVPRIRVPPLLVVHHRRHWASKHRRTLGVPL